MTEKPKILTVAEIDGIILRAEMYGRHELTDDAARSLCRMARAMAAQIERVAYTTHIVGEEWAVTVYDGHDGHARRRVTVGLVEAIEAAEEP